MMKKLLSVLWLLPALLLIAMPVAQASDGHISAMAGIVMHLNHYPDNNDQKVLAAIASDQHATAGEKILAAALQHMQHRVTDSDAGRLRQLLADASASRQEHSLATILLGIAHHPSASDKQQLKALLD